jgi:hypothetical protein
LSAQYSEDFLQQWEHLIDEANKTDIPVECIKKVVIKLPNKRQKTINLATLRKQGLEADEIEYIVTRQLNDFSDEVRDVEFVVDIAAVIDLVQPETDKLLNGLK